MLYQLLPATASHKVSVYHNSPGVNTSHFSSLAENEPGKPLFKVNSDVNALSNDLCQNLLKLFCAIVEETLESYQGILIFVTCMLS